MDLLGDNTWTVRCAALNALAAMKNTASVDRVEGVLSNDDSEYVRAGAAHALGRIGDKSAIGALSKAMNDDASDRVRGEAAAALLALGVKNPGDYKTASHPQQDAPHGTVGPTDTAVEL
ncbi:MAG TPA: HEAT repeat domain-containing protein, partial [bacterium]|nr:HEAT repeat domain-containing protein [bacterium]